jgi:hypothetical protein
MPWETHLRSRNVGESESLPSKQHVSEDYNKEADSVKCWGHATHVSSLVRNVPVVTSIEVSPFWAVRDGLPLRSVSDFLPRCRRRSGRWESGNPAFGFPRFPHSGISIARCLYTDRRPGSHLLITVPPRMVAGRRRRLTPRPRLGFHLRFHRTFSDFFKAQALSPIADF